MFGGKIAGIIVCVVDVWMPTPGHVLQTSNMFVGGRVVTNVFELVPLSYFCMTTENEKLLNYNRN